jgi:hypothetical protein
MQCFIDYIGLKGAPGAPGSGIFLQQLPGLTLENIEKIREADQESIGVMWADVQLRALRRFKKDYLRAFRTRYVGECCMPEECDPEVLACAYPDLFVDAWLFLLGSEMMIERLYSSRLNRFTTIDREMAAELKDHFQVEYEKSLEQVIAMLPREVMNRCYDCEGNIAQVESLP